MARECRRLKHCDRKSVMRWRDGAPTLGVCDKTLPQSSGAPRALESATAGLRASGAAHPHPRHCTGGRARHLPLRVLAGAAGHARQSRLVVFDRRLHEHHQCGGLSCRRAGRQRVHPPFRAVQLGLDRRARLCRVARDLGAVGRLHHLQRRAAVVRHRGGRRLCRRWRACHQHRAVAARSLDVLSKPVLYRPCGRIAGVGLRCAIPSAGLRTRLVVDRLGAGSP